MGGRRAVRARGDFDIAGLPSKNGWLPLYTIGVKCAESRLPPERMGNSNNRINPISDSVGHFVFWWTVKGGAD